MKYKDGRLYRRLIGCSRKDTSIYVNLGHPSDVKNKDVTFVGKKGEPYCLTPGKVYTVLTWAFSGKYCFDEQLRQREKNVSRSKGRQKRKYETSQSEDYFIQIINDKGHKRCYSHLMFKPCYEVKK